MSLHVGWYLFFFTIIVTDYLKSNYFRVELVGDSEKL